MRWWERETTLLSVVREGLLEEVSFAWMVRRIQSWDDVGNSIPGFGNSKCKVGSPTKAL